MDVVTSNLKSTTASKTTHSPRN
eukprot:COSAG03_NODE_10991_length_617_cov_1.583012_1_plen_22_part_10